MKKLKVDNSPHNQKHSTCIKPTSKIHAIIEVEGDEDYFKRYTIRAKVGLFFASLLGIVRVKKEKRILQAEDRG